MKKWNTHKYLLSYNNNKNDMSENLDNLNWYRNRFKKAFDYVECSTLSRISMNLVEIFIIMK